MIRNFGQKSLHELLELPENLVLLLVIAIGEPAEKIELISIPENGKTDYYRDADDIHYVPKRPLQDIIVEKAKP